MSSSREFLLNLSSLPRALLHDLANRAAKSLVFHEKLIVTALTDREQLGSTGLGQGIAIPHAALADIERPFGLLGRLNKAVDFEAIDDAPVDVVFMLAHSCGKFLG